FSTSSGIEVWLQDPEGDPRWNEEWSMDFEDFSGIQAIRAGGDIDHNGFPDIVFLVRIRTGFMQTQNFLHVLRETSEAEELWVRPIEPSGGEVLVAGSVRFIDWGAAIPEEFDADDALVDLYFSSRGPEGEWIEIAESIPNGGRYQWTVPDVASEACYIRYVLDLGEDVVEEVTPAPFTIIGGQNNPWLGVDPRSLDFGEILIDDFAEEIITLYNGGIEVVTVDEIELAIGDVFSIDWDEEPIELDEDNDYLLLVTFEPEERGEFFDTILIQSDCGDVEVPLAGSVHIPRPRLELSDDLLDFGEVYVDSSRFMQTTIYNSGDTIAVVTVNEPPEDEHFIWDPIDELSLDPNDSIMVDVEFIPPVHGEYQDQIVIEYQEGIWVVDLLGIGVSGPLIVLSTDTLDFGDVLVGTRESLTLYLMNHGGEDAVVNILRSPPGVFGWNPVNNRSIASDESLAVDVSFGSGVTGEYEGRLAGNYQLGEFDVVLLGDAVPEDDVDLESELPITYGILSITPNPFNTQARVSFGLPKASRVTVTIYDITGSFVTRLIEGELNAGYHTTVWNGQSASTGVYLICMEANEFSVVRKVMLVR
ncbi:MAG: T9SS type A sorting domain-containing protein, partial [Candidatus Electryoneaceae bacterium]|nr:T9SS type A sorting domain-containing protein [Candidatus Electryoneaceae bacterium]